MTNYTAPVTGEMHRDAVGLKMMTGILFGNCAVTENLIASGAT